MMDLPVFDKIVFKIKQIRTTESTFSWLYEKTSWMQNKARSIRQIQYSLRPKNILDIP